MTHTKCSKIARTTVENDGGRNRKAQRSGYAGLDLLYGPENALPAQNSREGPEVTPISKAIRNALVRRTSVSLRISVVFCRLELMVT